MKNQQRPDSPMSVKSTTQQSSDEHAPEILSSAPLPQPSAEPLTAPPVVTPTRKPPPPPDFRPPPPPPRVVQVTLLPTAPASSLLSAVPPAKPPDQLDFPKQDHSTEIALTSVVGECKGESNLTNNDNLEQEQMLIKQQQAEVAIDFLQSSTNHRMLIF